MRYNRTILGYHGCDAAVVEKVLRGQDTLKASENAYDWLGRGIYFWEHGPDRALQWAQAQADRDVDKPPIHRAPITEPAVIGALIHLGDCFDLLDVGNTTALAEWATAYRNALASRGELFPENKGPEPLRALRRGDCAVINTFIDMRQEVMGVRHDTVRGCFLEGEPIYEGSGILRMAHIQVAIRTPSCIIGYFRPTIGESHVEQDQPVAAPSPGNPGEPE